MAEVEKRWFTLAEVHLITGLALRTLQRECRAGLIDHHRKGRARVMDQVQIDALMAKCRVVAVEPATETAEEADRRHALARLQRRSAA